MTRAYGSNARLLMSPEASYGVTAKKYVQLPFKSCSLSSEQGLIEDPLLGYGRDPQAPIRDVIQDEGEIVVPLENAYMGIWLYFLLGPAKSVKGEGDLYTHTFTSGKTPLPSATIEVGLLDLSKYFVHSGVKVNSMSLDFARSGAASATFSVIAQGEEMDEQTHAQNPQILDFKRISQFQGKISRGDKPLSNLTEASLTYTNNLEKIETIRNDGKIEGLDATMAAFTGSLSVRFGNDTLMKEAIDGTPVSLEFAYLLKNGESLTLAAKNIYLPKPKLAIEGPSGIQASFEFQGAAYGADPLLEVKLVNSLKGDLYR